MSAPLPATFAALADPTRLAILNRLARGETGVGELAAAFPLSQPAISRHLKVLGSAGLVLRRAEGTRRLCRLNPAALAPVQQWATGLEAALAANYRRLDAVLATESEKDPSHVPET